MLARLRRCALQCALAFAMAAPVALWAANACIVSDSPGPDAPNSGGIGGTGAPDRTSEGGSGGTGSTAQSGGTGGTGNVAGGGTGGTGNVAGGGTGGTGNVAGGGTGGTGNVAGGGTGGTGNVAGGGTGGTGNVAGGGTGGTGNVASGGIGGTGKQADTGGMGGTGIVGVITGFASVCVNGMEVHIDAQTQVTRNGGPATPADLAVGHFVSIEAAPGRRVGMRAARIAMLDAAVGPVTRAGKDLEVLGQSVRLSAETRGGAGALKVGDRVRVSGPRASDNTVVATRIERTDTPVDSVAGPATTTITGGVRIAGVNIAGARVSADIKGREALATGRWEGGKLIAERIEADPATRFRSQVRDVVLEGFPAPAGKRDRIRVAGKEVELPSAGGKIARDQLVRVTGRIGDDGVVQASRIEVRRELLPRSERGRRSEPGELDPSDGKGGDGDRDGKGGDGDRDGKGGDDDRSGSDSGRDGGDSDRDGKGGDGDRSGSNSGRDGGDSDRDSGRSGDGRDGGSDSSGGSSGSDRGTNSERRESGSNRSSDDSGAQDRSRRDAERSTSGGSRDRVERSSSGGSRDRVERSSSGSGRDRSRDR